MTWFQSAVSGFLEFKLFTHFMLTCLCIFKQCFQEKLQLCFVMKHLDFLLNWKRHLAFHQYRSELTFWSDVSSVLEF